MAGSQRTGICIPKRERIQEVLDYKLLYEYKLWGGKSMHELGIQVVYWSNDHSQQNRWGEPSYTLATTPSKRCSHNKLLVVCEVYK